MAERYPFFTAIENPYADDLIAFDIAKNGPFANSMEAVDAADNDVVP